MNTSIQCKCRRRWAYPLLSLLFATSSILAIPQPVNADLFDLIFQGIRIMQISNLSDDQEVELGQQINAQIVQEVRIYNHLALTQYVNEIGQSLARYSNRPHIPYKVQVVDDDDDSINAFATLGGFVYIHTGLLRAADNEAQLASVIAHEMGHIERRHSIQQLQQAAIAEGLLGAGGLDQNVAISIGVDLALHRPNSRIHELEADQVGLTLLKETGYASIAAVDFLRKLLDQPGRLSDFLSTHPNPEDRIAALESEIGTTGAIGRSMNNAAYRYRIRTLL